MSIAHVHALWGKMADYAPSESVIALFLAWRANTEGYVQESNDSIIASTGLSERTVKAAKQALLARGVLRATAHAHGGRGNNVIYQLHLPGLQKGANPAPGNPKGANPENKGADSAANAGKRVQVSAVGNGVGVDSEVLNYAKPTPETKNTNARSADLIGNPEVWEILKAELKKIINPHSFDTWLKPLRFKSFANGELALIAPTQQFTDCVERWEKELSAAVHKTGLKIASIRVGVLESDSQPERPYTFSGSPASQRRA